MGGTGGAAMSRAEVDEALGRLRKEEDDITAALLAVTDHPGYRLLDGASLAGVTLERWTAASATVGTLWQGLDAHKSAPHPPAAPPPRPPPPRPPHPPQTPPNPPPPPPPPPPPAIP